VAVDLFTLWAVHPMFHPVGIVGLAFVLYCERHLSALAFPMISGVRILHALLLLRAVAALQQTTLEIGSALAVLICSGSVVLEAFACRANAGQADRIELEFTGRDDLFPTRGRLVLMALAVLGFLVLELRVPAPESVIRHVTIDLPFVQVLHVGFVGEAGIGGNDDALLVDVVCNTQFLEAGFHTLQYRLQGMVLLTFAKGLGVDDDLVFLVHCSHAVIALDGALAGGHLGASVIGDVALHFLAPFPLAHPWAARL